MSRESKKTLSATVRRIPEPGTIKMAQLARDLVASGVDVIDLSMGEPDFDTPAHIRDAAIDAIQQGYTKYTSVFGRPELREAIARKLQEENRLAFTTPQIVATNGAKQAITYIALSLLNDGDEAIILAPHWASYPDIVHLAGGIPKLVSAGIDDGYKVSAEMLDAAITPRTRCIFFSSPCNPTGAVYSQSELQAFARVIAAHEHVFVVTDEIYEYINFTGEHVSIAEFDGIRDRTIIVNGFSKGFAMTGWRLGYLAGPEWLAKACGKLQGVLATNPTTFCQMAGVHALQADRSASRAMRDAYHRRSQWLVAALSDVPGMRVIQPEGALYVFPDISGFFGTSFGDLQIVDSVSFCEFLLHEAHVAVVPGAAFGHDDGCRISYSYSEADLERAVERIKKAVSRLR